jgi:hypothetical protein
MSDEKLIAFINDQNVVRNINVFNSQYLDAATEEYLTADLNEWASAVLSSNEPGFYWKDSATVQNEAIIGHTYNQDLNAFVPPKPYESWVLDEVNFVWNAPIPQPSLEVDQGGHFEWNEDVQNWVLVSE